MARDSENRNFRETSAPGGQGGGLTERWQWTQSESPSGWAGPELPLEEWGLRGATQGPPSTLPYSLHHTQGIGNVQQSQPSLTPNYQAPCSHPVPGCGKQPRTDSSKSLLPHLKGQSLGPQGWEVQAPAACHWTGRDRSLPTALLGFVRHCPMNKEITPRLERSQPRGPETREEGTGLSVLPWVTPWGNARPPPSPGAGGKGATICGTRTSDPGLPHGPCDVASLRNTIGKEERGWQGLSTVARAGVAPRSVG